MKIERISGIMEHSTVREVESGFRFGPCDEATQYSATEIQVFRKAASTRMAPGFAAMRSLAHAAMDAGAAGVMIAPPPSLRTDDQIVAYFCQAVDTLGADVPWVLQDYPLALSVIMTPGVIRRVIQDCPSCVMLKHEDWPGLDKISVLRGFQKEGSM